MSDGVALAIQKSDVQDSADQRLAGGVSDSGAHRNSDQSGVGLVTQVGRDKESSLHIHSQRVRQLHPSIGCEIGGVNNSRSDKTSDRSSGNRRTDRL